MRKLTIKLLLLTLAITLYPCAPRTVHAAVISKMPSSLGLVGYWKLDEGNGTIAGDSSGLGNNGSLVNSPTWTTGKRGGAMLFSNPAHNGSFVSVPNFDYGVMRQGSETASWTLSIWARQTPGNGGENVLIGRDGCNGGIYTYNGGYAFAIKTDACWTNSQSIYATPTNMDAWHHLVAVYNSRAMTFYVDGVSAGTATFSATMNAYATTLGIGAGGGSYYAFNGALDDARVYNRALSGSEVTALYQSGAVKMISGAKPSQISGLIGWWDAADADQVKSGSDCTGTVANGGSIGCLKDKSASGNNMTQPTVGSRPTYQLNIKNGNAVVRMASQTLYTSTNFPAPVTVIYAAHHTGGLNGRMLSGVSNNWLLGYWGGGKRQAYFEGWVSAAGSPSSDTGWNTYSAVIPGSGQNTLVYENGSQVFSNQGGVTGPNGLTLDGEYSEFSNGETGEVLVYNRALTDAERSSVERYLNNKWAVGYSGVARATNTGISSSRNSRLTNGLVGLWSFDGADISGTTLYDRSGQGNNATISGGQVAPGRVGQGYAFVVGTERVYTASNAILNTDTHTISFWIKFNTNSTYWGQILDYRPAGSDRSPGIWTYSGSNCIHWRYDPGNSGPTSCGGPAGENTYYTVGEWYHITGVKNGGTFTFYVNGVQQEQGAVPNPKTAGNASVEMGSASSAAAIVSLDDVRVYNRALSASEVYQLYSLGK